MTGRALNGSGSRPTDQARSGLGGSRFDPSRGFTEWEHEPDEFDRDLDEYCTMGVGCDEVGLCYAAAQGKPQRCPRDPENKAWEWLYAYSQRGRGEDPEDCDFSAEQMVDAYLAGAASGIETGGQDAEDRLGAEHESPTAESGDAQ